MIYAVIFCSLVGGVLAPPAEATTRVPPAYQHVAQRIGAEPELLFALALVESGYTADARFLPWPWTLNIAGRGYYFSSYQTALTALEKALAQQRSVDVGLLQISWRWHGERFASPGVSLNPQINLTTGADILYQHYRQSGDWWLAVERYHAPGRDAASRQRAQAYRQRVFKRWQTLKRFNANAKITM